MRESEGKAAKGRQRSEDGGSVKQKRRKARRKSDWIVIVDVPKLLRFLALTVMSVLAVLSILQVVKRVLPVREFSVVGISVYEPLEIVSASGVRRGDLLYLLDEDEIEARILEECPYLLSAKVKPIFPNKLRIEIEGRNAQWYIDVSGTKYALDSDLVVLDEVGKTDGLTQLLLPNVKSVMCGSVPKFSESDTELKKTLEVIAAIRQCSFRSRLTLVDLESRWDIRIQVDGAYEVLMGDTSDFEAKLLAVEQILDSERLRESVGGEIDVSLPQTPAVKPIYPKGSGSEEK